MSKRLYKQCLGIAKKNIHRCTETNNHFSFIIQSNKIISWGYNRRGRVNKRLGYKWYSNIHSEVDAYNKIKPKQLIKNDKEFPWYIINIRLNNLKESMLSMPCDCCNNFLTILGCSKVLYSTQESFNKMKL